jgi:VanZ family protein
MLSFLQQIVLRWKLFYLYTVFLILMSVLPINSGSSINHIFLVSIRLDYLLHCLVYIPLVAFTWIDKEIISTWTVKAFGWIMALLLFAAVTEWVQYFLPYRAFNINDLLANALGVTLGILVLTLVRLKLKK